MSNLGQLYKNTIVIVEFFACGFIYEFMLWRTDDREGLIGENVYLRVGGAK